MKPKIKVVRTNKKLKKNGEQSLSLKQWIVGYREIEGNRLKKYVMVATLMFFGVSLIFTFGIFLLVGFNFLGFSLPETLLNKMGWATIGQTAGLTSVALKLLFKN